MSALERSETAKGTYLAHRVHHRGKATVDVLGDVLAGLLRDFSFPKQMRWDAYLDDGKGELVFARPIRWLVLLYGGRVVPFVIRRHEIAQGPLVQDVRTAANTYGHRFLTTSGRAGRAIAGAVARRLDAVAPGRLAAGRRRFPAAGRRPPPRRWRRPSRRWA